VYVQPPSVEVEASVGSVGVSIRAESDFYEPLSPYGRWEVVGSYGRCWIPARVEANWRPYSNGRWQRTDAGWYWSSEEPWAWATYHYGRWDFSGQFGWYWVPQTQWAPAWVSWHEGGGNIGWAPLHPSARISVGGSVELNVALIAPQAFVFVEPRRFLQPVSPTTVVVNNNTTIINKTVNITNIKIVNNTVINEGPRTQVIEQASGQKLQAVPVRELRRKQEAAVVARQRTSSPGREKKEGNVQAPIRSESAPREARVPLNAERLAKESEATAREQSQKSARELENKNQVESQRPANPAAKIQEETRGKAKASERTAQRELQRRKDLEKKAHAEAEKKAQKNKGKGKPSPPEDPPVTPPASP
jgi:hypothetical protein